MNREGGVFKNNYVSFLPYDPKENQRGREGMEGLPKWNLKDDYMPFYLDDRLKEAPIFHSHLVIKRLSRRLLSPLAQVTWENPNNNVSNKWQ